MLRKVNKTIGEFWDYVFSYHHPPSISVCFGACFAVAKDPKSFYEKLLTFVSDHPNPEEGHYLERLWIAMFTKQK